MIERLPCVPDDRGASCPDIPDAISFRSVAREWARNRRRSVSEDAAFDDLLRAFWNGEFEHNAQPDGGDESLVFTLEVPRGTSPDHPYSVTEDGHVLKRVVDEITGRARDIATSERQLVFWTRREFFRFIARFWDSNESASTGLADFGTADEAFHFMAACSVEDYPTMPRALVERLHISRAALEGAKRGAVRNHAKRQLRPREKAESPAKAGAPEKPIWRQIYPHVLAWLDDEGEPDTRAEVERYMRDLLAKRDEHVARSTLQEHARRCIEQHRKRRQPDN